jgi:hypothetical protein
VTIILLGSPLGVFTLQSGVEPSRCCIHTPPAGRRMHMSVMPPGRSLVGGRHCSFAWAMPQLIERRKGRFGMGKRGGAAKHQETQDAS